jgi:uncharacterized protein (DUF2236 family)
MLLGWGRAILLQLAHPLVAAGVHEHSTVRTAPWTAAARLHATVRAMLALTFGTTGERESAVDGIRAIHRRVNGRLPMAVGPFPAGTRYSAEDPDLVLWVHVTLLDSIPLVYSLFVAPLTEAERDAYCADAAAVAIALGAREAEVPRTWAALRAHLARVHASGVIAVGAQARELSNLVLAPWIARVIPPAAWLNRLVSLALLPPHVRDGYQFAWTPRQQRTFDRLVPLVRRLRRQAPNAAALWPEARTPRPPTR